MKAEENGEANLKSITDLSDETRQNFVDMAEETWEIQRGQKC